MPPPFVCPDPVGFCWWLLTALAPLYQYDDYGVHKDLNLTVDIEIFINRMRFLSLKKKM